LRQEGVLAEVPLFKRQEDERDKKLQADLEVAKLLLSAKKP
jgi:hypothetical protein